MLLHITNFSFNSDSIMTYPYSAGSFQNPSHGISGNTIILDDKRIKVQQFTYDGRFLEAFIVITYCGISV